MTNSGTSEHFVNEFWDKNIIPTLKEYIRIPNKSPSFDPEWEAHGHMEKALKLAVDWLNTHKIPGSNLQIGRIPGRTPLILLEIPGDTPQNVLMYGHFDKQPEFEGWHEGLGPWEPVIKDNKLYGRGGADDGYAVFSALCAIKSIKEKNLPCPRIVLIIEFSEESGSPDLIPHCEKFADVIGSPDLIVCLDAGGANYDQMWVNTSLRGLLTGILSVQVLEEGAHSGGASGIIPSSFRIATQLVSRVENPETGEIVSPELQVKIPEHRVREAKDLSKTIGDTIFNKYTLMPNMKPMSHDNAELILNSTWRPTLSYIGVEGIPSLKDGGNVLRPKTALKLSFRLPPTLSAKKAKEFLEKALSQNPPCGAKVKFTVEDFADGWNASELSHKMQNIVHESCKKIYGKPPLFMGLGGSIPFMGFLGEKFPKAEFVITGVLGPSSNAHGPNEFLHIPFAKKLTACVAQIIEKFAGV